MVFSGGGPGAGEKAWRTFILIDLERPSAPTSEEEEVIP
jgi:hypothetical protein